MIIRRKFQFDAAHMLSQYRGKCNNLHGHTYTGECELRGEVNPDGMLVDYNTIKSIVDKYDHALLVSGEYVRDEDENELLKWARIYGKNLVEMPNAMKCTAENIAYCIASDLRVLQGVDYAKVWLHETPDSTAIAEA